MTTHLTSEERYAAQAESFEDRFLDTILDKGPIYGLVTATVLGVFIGVEQFILWVTA